MRSLILAAVAVTGWSLPTPAQDPDHQSKETPADALFKELSAKLPRDGPRAAAARLELSYWHENQWPLHDPPTRKSVKTRDGQVAEVVFLSVLARTMPGVDFSMAFLLVEKRVVDWASCWTHNRNSNQELLLEDVDGDGFNDVAFRTSKGGFGLTDKRQHGRPGDPRKWLYAYAVTATGFRSLFPETERDLTVRVTYDTAGQPVTLAVKGLSESLRERRLVECTITATNTSNDTLAIKPGQWYWVSTIDSSFFLTYGGPPDQRGVLKPGESVSQVVRLLVAGTSSELTLRWKFVPAR